MSRWTRQPRRISVAVQGTFFDKAEASWYLRVIADLIDGCASPEEMAEVTAKDATAQAYVHEAMDFAQRVRRTN